MKILILDGNIARHRSFAKNLIGNEIIHVTEASNAIQLLDNNAFDVVFLDHDLPGEIYVDSFGNKLTGYTVAKWLSEHPDKTPNKVYIHSFNRTAAKIMKDVLPKAELTPGIWTEFNLNNTIRHES